MRPALAAMRVDLRIDIGEQVELRALVDGVSGPVWL